MKHLLLLVIMIGVIITGCSSGGNTSDIESTPSPKSTSANAMVPSSTPITEPNQTPKLPTPTTDQSAAIISIQYQWECFDESWTYNASISEELYNHSKEQTRSATINYSSYVSPMSENSYLNGLIKKFEEANTENTNDEYSASVYMAICFVRGKKPPEDTITMAREHNLPLLATRVPMFESCGRLYHNGLKGCSEVETEVVRRESQ